MTDDQHRIGQTTKAEIYLAGILERFAGIEPDQRPDPARIAAAAVTELQGYGWRLPAVLEDPPPARPANPADDNSPGRQAFRAGLCDRYGHQPLDGHCDRCGAALTTSQQK